MSNRFLITNSGDLTDGTFTLNVNSITCTNMSPSLPVKTDAGGKMISTLLDIADIQGLAAIIYGFVTNPMTLAGGPLDTSGLGIINGGLIVCDEIRTTDTWSSTLNADIRCPNGVCQVISNSAGFGGMSISGFDTSAGFNRSLRLNDGDLDMNAHEIQRCDAVHTQLITDYTGVPITISTPGLNLNMVGIGQVLYNGCNVHSTKYVNYTGFNYNPPSIGVPFDAIPTGSTSVPIPVDGISLHSPPSGFECEIRGVFSAGLGGDLAFELFAGPTSTTSMGAMGSTSVLGAHMYVCTFKGHTLGSGAGAPITIVSELRLDSVGAPFVSQKAEFIFTPTIDTTITNLFNVKATVFGAPTQMTVDFAEFKFY